MVIFRHQSRKNRAIMKSTPLKIFSCFKIFCFSGLSKRTPYEHRKKCNLQTILLQKVPSLFFRRDGTFYTISSLNPLQSREENGFWTALRYVYVIVVQAVFCHQRRHWKANRKRQPAAVWQYTLEDT